MRERSIPSKEMLGALQAVPAVATDFITVNAWISSISIANTTAGALTFTVLDKQATPQTLVPTVSVAANTAVLFEYGEQMQFMKGGITWSASGTGMTGSIAGFCAG